MERDAASTTSATTRPAAGQVILLVDDYSDGLDLLTFILAGAGFPSVACGSAAEALKLLRSDPLPAVVITDLNMPMTNGDELARVLRSEARTATLKVVLLTADQTFRSADGL